MSLDGGSGSALRKQLLVMRASVERAELAETVQDIRSGLRWTSLLKGAVPGLAARQGLPLLAQILRRYPLISTASSLALARLRPHVSLVGLLRISVIAGLAWQAWTIVRGAQKARGVRPPRPPRPPRVPRPGRKARATAQDPVSTPGG